jgi:hypothetical protein
MKLPHQDWIPRFPGFLVFVIAVGLAGHLNGTLIRPAAADEVGKLTPDRRIAAGSRANVGHADSPAAPDKGVPNVPELLYLTWQRGKNADGKPVPHKLWDLKGTIVPEEKAKKVLDTVGSFHAHWWKPKDELRPLVLVFRVDPKIERGGIMVSVIDDRYRSYVGGTGAFAVKDGLTVSTAVPQKGELQGWPKQIALDVKYPIENVQSFKTVENIPDAPIPVAEGVEWLVEDGRGLNDRRPAAVLRLQDGKGDWKLHNYTAHCYLRGKPKPLSIAYKTIIDTNDGVSYQIDVSSSFAGPQDVEKVEFRRQRHAVARVEKIPLRLDLMPADPESEPSDEE